MRVLLQALKNYSSISQKEVAQNAQPLVFYWLLLVAFLGRLRPLVPTNQTIDQVNKVFPLNLKAFSPPKIDGEYIGRCPENPLFAVDSRHQELADTIGRICNGIPERPIGSNWLVNIAKYQPPNGTDRQVLGPAYRIQLTSNKLLLFLFELGLVDQKVLKIRQ